MDNEGFVEDELPVTAEICAPQDRITFNEGHGSTADAENVIQRIPMRKPPTNVTAGKGEPTSEFSVTRPVDDMDNGGFEQGDIPLATEIWASRDRISPRGTQESIYDVEKVIQKTERRKPPTDDNGAKGEPTRKYCSMCPVDNIDNEGFVQDELSVTSEICAPEDRITLSGGRQSREAVSLDRHSRTMNDTQETTTRNLPTAYSAAKSVTIGKISPLSKEPLSKQDATSVLNTILNDGESLRKPEVMTVFRNDESGYRRKETVVCRQKWKAEVTFISNELQKPDSKSEESFANQHLWNPAAVSEVKLIDRTQKADFNTDGKTNAHDIHDVRRAQTDGRLETDHVFSEIIDVQRAKERESKCDVSAHALDESGSNVRVKVKEHGKDVQQTRRFGLKSDITRPNLTDRTGSKHGDMMCDTSVHEDVTVIRNDIGMTHNQDRILTATPEFSPKSAVADFGLNSGVTVRAGSKHGKGACNVFVPAANRSSYKGDMAVSSFSNDENACVPRVDTTGDCLPFHISDFKNWSDNVKPGTDNRIRQGTFPRVNASYPKEYGYSSIQVVPGPDSSISFGFLSTEVGTDYTRVSTDVNGTTELRQKHENASGYVDADRIGTSAFTENEFISDNSSSLSFTDVQKDGTETKERTVDSDRVLNVDGRPNMQLVSTGSDTPQISVPVYAEYIKDRHFKHGPLFSSPEGYVSSFKVSSFDSKPCETVPGTNINVSMHLTLNRRPESPHVLGDRINSSDSISHTNIPTAHGNVINNTGHRKTAGIENVTNLEGNSFDSPKSVSGIVPKIEVHVEKQPIGKSQPPAAMSYVEKPTVVKHEAPPSHVDCTDIVNKTSRTHNPPANWTRDANESNTPVPKERQKGKITNVKDSIVHVKNSATPPMELGPLSIQDNDSRQKSEHSKTSQCSDLDAGQLFSDLQTHSDDMSSHKFYNGLFHEMTSIQKVSEPLKCETKFSHTTNNADQIKDLFAASDDLRGKGQNDAVQPHNERGAWLHRCHLSGTNDSRTSIEVKVSACPRCEIHDVSSPPCLPPFVTKGGKQGSEDTSQANENFETIIDGFSEDKIEHSQTTSPDTMQCMKKNENVKVNGDNEDDGLNRINVVGIDNDSGTIIVIDRVEAWVTHTNPTVQRPFDRHSITEMPIMVQKVTAPIQPIHSHSNSKHIQLDLIVVVRHEHDVSEGSSERMMPKIENQRDPPESIPVKTFHKNRLVTASKGDDASVEMVDLDEHNTGSGGTTAHLSFEQFFNKEFFEGWSPSSPYAHHIQRNPSSLSEGGNHTVGGKSKVRQLSLAIGEEWEDMIGTQHVTATEDRDSGYQLSWGGSSELNYLGKTFRYLSHPGRLESSWKRKTVPENGDSAETTVSRSTAEASGEQATQAGEPQDQSDTEKRWPLPNPYNRFNQRCHSTLQCPCCLFFCFICCLPAVYFMQLSDTEFDHGSKDKARVLGRRASFLYVIGAIGSLITLSVVITVVVIYLQDYLTRKHT